MGAVCVVCCARLGCLACSACIVCLGDLLGHGAIVHQRHVPHAWLHAGRSGAAQERKGAGHQGLKVIYKAAHRPARCSCTPRRPARACRTRAPVRLRQQEDAVRRLHHGKRSRAHRAVRAHAIGRLEQTRVAREPRRRRASAGRACLLPPGSRGVRARLACSAARVAK